MGGFFTGLTLCVRAGPSCGTIQTLEINSALLRGKRTVMVYRPPGYTSSPRRRYPVLYLLDGQNVFDAGESPVTWSVERTAQRLIHSRRIPPILMVAVYNSPRRIEEYTAVPDPGFGGGRGRIFARFLVEELKPVIDSLYRTTDECALMGSSLGALMALHMGFCYAGIFRKVAALSPSLWWADGAPVKMIERWDGPGPESIWLDAGTAEGGALLARLRRMRDVLMARGYAPDATLHYREVAGAGHDETSWGERVADILAAFFGSPRPRYPRTMIQSAAI